MGRSKKEAKRARPANPRPESKAGRKKSMHGTVQEGKKTGSALKPNFLESRIWGEDPILRRFRLRKMTINGRPRLVREAKGPLSVEGLELLLRIKALGAKGGLESR